jgi:energy-converting hydrogenase Eha subunit F
MLPNDAMPQVIIPYIIAAQRQIKTLLKLSLVYIHFFILNWINEYKDVK